MLSPIAFLVRTAFLSLSLTTLTLVAQEPATQTSHQKAAQELYLLIGGKNTAEAGAEAMLAAALQNNPGLVEYEDVLRAWYQKVFTDPGFEREIVEVYVKNYTEPEIKELLRFYHSEVGRKSLKVLPEIMRQGAAIGSKYAQLHSAELQNRMMEAMKKRHPEQATNEDVVKDTPTEPKK